MSMASTSTLIPTSPASDSTFNGSRRNSLMKRVARSLTMTSTHQKPQSSSEFISEPPRTAGSMVSAVGRRLSLDRAVHSFKGLGPSTAVLRLISALHEMHCNWLVEGSKAPPCLSDHSGKMDPSVPLAHRLIWACNGFCSRCRSAYVPNIMDKPAQLSETAEKAIAHLVKCIRPSEPASKIDHAALYLRLITESRILSVSMIMHLGLLDGINNCWEVLNLDPPQEFVALRGAVKALQASENEEESSAKGSFSRFRLKDDAAVVLERYFNRLSESEDQDITHMIYSQLLTYVCRCAEDTSSGSVTADDLLVAVDRARTWPGISRYFVAHSLNAYLWVAGADASDESQVLEGHAKMIISVAFSSDGTKIVSGAQDGTLRLWSADDRDDSVAFVFKKGSSGRVKFTTGGEMIAPSTIQYASGDFELSHDAAGRKTLLAQKAYQRGLGFTMSSDGRLDALWRTPGRGDMLELYTKNCGGVVEECHLRHEVVVTSAAFSPDCTHIVSGTCSGAMVLWRIIPGQVDQVGALRGHRDAVNAVAFSPEGAQIASGSRDRSLRLWDPQSSRQTAVWYGTWATSLAFSPDGAHLVCGSQDSTVQLWDVKTGHLITVLKGHTSPVLTVTFAPNGLLIASSSEEDIIQLWNISKIMDAKKLILDAEETEEEWTVVSEEDSTVYNSDQEGKDSDICSLKRLSM